MANLNTLLVTSGMVRMATRRVFLCSNLYLVDSGIFELEPTIKSLPAVQGWCRPPTETALAMSYTKAQVTRRGVALNVELLCIYTATSETELLVTNKKRSIVQDQREKETMEHLLSSRARRCKAGDVLRLAMQVKMEVWRLCKG